MPIFDFRCMECEHEFEDLAYTRQVKATCPKCGEVADKLQIIGKTSFSLSHGGMGWAATGYDKPSGVKDD